MELNIPGNWRPRTTYIAGNPGFGKSSLIQKMALHDIQRNRGVCIIDPTGDLVDRLIHFIPKSRIEDTIYFDTDNPVPIDFFSYSYPAERQVLTDQLIDLFHLDNAPVSKPRLMKILGTLFDANENSKIEKPENRKDRCTFMDILHFIEDPIRQRKILSYCPHRQKQWARMPPPKEFESIVERMTPFMESPALRKLFSAKHPKLNIKEVMQKKMILLVNLKDTDTDCFIGSLIASKFQQSTFARRYVRESDRVPYYLYIDECNTVLKHAVQNFESILVRARKYKLCLTLGNQIPEDLPRPIQRKLGTIGTLVLFNLDTQNTHLFKDRIFPYEAGQLVNLPEFQAIARVKNQVQWVNTPRFLGFSRASYAQIIKTRTVDKYSCDIEDDMLDSKQDVAKPDPADDRTLLSDSTQTGTTRIHRPVRRTKP